MSIPWVQGKQQVTLQKSTSLEQYCTNYHTNLRATKISQSIHSGSRNRMPQDSTILGQISQDIEANWNIRRIGKHWDIFDQILITIWKAWIRLTKVLKHVQNLNNIIQLLKNTDFRLFIGPEMLLVGVLKLIWPNWTMVSKLTKFDKMCQGIVIV